jgi:FtsZ-binding cell division protein ZapB
MVSQMKTTLVLLGVMTLAGCQSLSSESIPAGCGEIPSYADNVCLVDSWVAFGLQAQRGDDDWRERTLDKVGQDRMDQKAVRALVLSWDGPGEWQHASNLYKASIDSAPARLQPLLQQWLNELEERRKLYAQRSTNASRQGSHNDTQAVKRENEKLKQQLKEMSDKLDALTDIERTINARD